MTLRQREPRRRDSAYLGWIARAPCVACLVTGRGLKYGVQVAHLRMASHAHGKRDTGGAEKPSDIWTTPLCPSHHQHGREAQHVMGERRFWEWLAVDPFDLCLELRGAYEIGGLPGPIIARHASAAVRKRQPRVQDL